MYKVVRDNDGTFVFTGPGMIEVRDENFDRLLQKATQSINPQESRYDKIRDAFDAAAVEYNIGVAV